MLIRERMLIIYISPQNFAIWLFCAITVRIENRRSRDGNKFNPKRRHLSPDNSSVADYRGSDHLLPDVLFDL